jgi:lipoprotein Spr
MLKYINLTLISLILVSCQSAVRYSSNNKDQKIGDDFQTNNQKLEKYIHDWLGTPYRYGGINKKGIDCSGFSLMVLKNVYNREIPRQTKDQFQKGKHIRINNLIPGDLIFFSEIRSRGIDHVGIFLGSGKFVHASESAGVVISDMNDSYYRTKYSGACRY